MKIQHIALVIIPLLLSSCVSKRTKQMVFVEGGSFYMGSTAPESDPDEKEIHLQTVGNFYISKYEVTQAEWCEVMKINPSYFKNDTYPVECVSWDDVQLFINRLNKRTGRHYRLPTQAEWEYAARGGKYANNDQFDINEEAWIRANSGKTTHRVGLLKPNALGLYDMIGNVHEWCDGLYDSVFYVHDSLMKQCYDFMDIRVFKGGSWASDEKHCRISNINYNSRETRNFSIGFRLAEDEITTIKNRCADGI